MNTLTKEQIDALPGLVDDATPGPWRVEQGTTLIWGHCNPDDASNRGMGYPVSECRITPTSSWAKGPDADAGEGNARLIALAPSLAATAIEQQRIITALSEDASKAAGLAGEVERLRWWLSEIDMRGKQYGPEDLADLAREGLNGNPAEGVKP